MWRLLALETHELGGFGGKMDGQTGSSEDRPHAQTDPLHRSSTPAYTHMGFHSKRDNGNRIANQPVASWPTDL